MIISNLTIGKKRSSFIMIIQLILIMAYFAVVPKAKEIQDNKHSSDLEILSGKDLNKTSENSNPSNEKSEIIIMDSNKNADINEKQSHNNFSIISAIKYTFTSFIKLNNNYDDDEIQIPKNNLMSFSETNFQQSQTNSKKTLNCKANPVLKSLVISTNSDPISEEFNIDILRECEISEMWRIRNTPLKSCESPKCAIEGEDNIRRAFRFSYLPQQNQKANLTDTTIVINKMSLEYPKSAAESMLTKSKLILNQGDVTDIYLNYDCKYSEQGRSSASSDDWYKIRVSLELADGLTQSFEFIKVCNASYIESVDASHFIILSFIFLVAYLSTKDFLKSKFEVIIVEKFTEMRNPENLMLIGLVVSLILIFLGVTGFFPAWTTIVIIILAPVSIAMIGEALLKYHDILTHLESRSYEIPYIGSISFLFSLCFGVGLFLVSLYFLTENWLLNNIISIAIALITIRLLKFTNFKLILIMFSLRFSYDLIWSYYYSKYFSENFRLSNSSHNHLPIKFLCPEFASTPFNSCNFLPIADIILPGILCTYAKIFDESKGTNMYFLASNASLAVGLILNMFVYYSYKLPLPSFLFSGPVMILTVVIIAHNKGHLHKFVEGFSSTLLENNLDKNLKNISFQQKLKSGIQYVPPKI